MTPRTENLGQAASPFNGQRIVWVDSVRGLAVLGMVTYHFAWDLAFFNIGSIDLWWPVQWVVARTFLLISGVSLALAKSGWKRQLARITIIMICAAVVTLGSMILTPRSPIVFGVLHLIVISTLVVAPVRQFPIGSLLIGGALIAGGPFIGRFQGRGILPTIIGYPAWYDTSVDYYPIIPWAGYVFVGCFLGSLISRYHLPRTGQLGFVTVLGRHALLLYIVHQPILLGLVWMLRSNGNH